MDLDADVAARASRQGPSHGDVAKPDVAFAGVARLELDELLEQLLDRVRDVQRSQDRLRGLLYANLKVAQGVDIEDVLQHILGAAKELVDARYAALGLVRDGHVVRFLHVGMDEDVVARIGNLPQGKGVLGALVEDPHPVRLRNIAEHPASVGFPDHHPPMASFLGVPISVRNQVFGNLYLTEKRGGGQFSRDDEDVVCALAAAAGIAIENATLFADSQRRREWQSAMVKVATELLGGADIDQAVRYLVEQVRDASGADGTGFSLVTDDPDWLHTVVAQDLLAPFQGELVPFEGSLAGAAITQLRTVQVADPAQDERVAAWVTREPRIGPTLVAPVVSEGGVRGALIICRRVGGGTFSDGDVGLITAFTAQAALVLELALIRRDNEQLQLLQDRQRIAGDLSNNVIRELFSFGLSLHGIASRVRDTSLQQELMRKVDGLDRVIHDIRDAIFALDPARVRTLDQEPPQAV